MNKEYIIRKSSTITLNITDGKVDSFREIDESNRTIRVYEDGKIGVAGGLGEVDMAELEAAAISKLANGIPYKSTLNAGVKKQIINEKPAIDKEKILPTAKRLAKVICAPLKNTPIRLSIRESTTLSLWKPRSALWKPCTPLRGRCARCLV